MNILLCHPKKDTLEMIHFCLENQTDLVVHSAANFQDALEFLLDESSIDLVITSQHAETDKLFKFLLSANSPIPVILLDNSANETIDTYPDIQILGKIQLKDLSEKLIPLIKKTFKQPSRTDLSNEYCQIKTSLLIRTIPLKADLYIRLSSLKFVKIFKAGAVFTKDELETFLKKKKISFLYVKKTESQEFVQKFIEDLNSQFNDLQPDDPTLLDTIVETQELIQELSSRLGFDSEVRQIVKLNVNMTMKMIGNSPKLSKVLHHSQLSKKNFISGHSVLLASISCSISALMTWPSDTTFQKLVMTSLFHDFTFQNSDHAKITGAKQLEERRPSLTEDEYHTIKNHPIKSAELIKQLHEVPSDVDTIVIQHHERPDGSGFPRGLNAHQIAPLAAVFIVAHDIVDCLAAERNGFDLAAFLKKNESLYQGHTFRKVWVALSNSDSKLMGAQGSKTPAA